MKGSASHGLARSDTCNDSVHGIRTDTECDHEGASSPQRNVRHGQSGRRSRLRDPTNGITDLAESADSGRFLDGEAGDGAVPDRGLVAWLRGLLG
jgi:hypothetical protein